MSEALRISTTDGKYTVVQDEKGRTQILRYGNPWRDITGDGAILALAYELAEARTTLAHANHIARELLANGGAEPTDLLALSLLFPETPLPGQRLRMLKVNGYTAQVNHSPAEILNENGKWLLRWKRLIGHFDFEEDHGGYWSNDSLTWSIDGKSITFTRPPYDA